MSLFVCFNVFFVVVCCCWIYSCFGVGVGVFRCLRLCFLLVSVHFQVAMVYDHYTIVKASWSAVIGSQGLDACIQVCLSRVPILGFVLWTIAIIPPRKQTRRSKTRDTQDNSQGEPIFGLPHETNPFWVLNHLGIRWLKFEFSWRNPP